MSDYQVNVDIRTSTQTVSQAREELNRMNQQIRRAGTEGDQSTRVLSSGLSGATGNALRFVAALGAGAAAALSVQRIVNSIRNELVAINRLNDVSLFTGIDPLGLSSLQARATAAGVSLDSVTSAIARQERALENASRGSAQYVRFFQDLNLNVSELQRLNPEERFQRITNALQQGAAEGRNVANAVRALAGNDPQILKLAGSSAELAAQLARVRLVGAEADEALLAQSARVDQAVNQTSLAFQGLRQNILRALGDEIVGSTEGFAGFVENLARTVDAVRVLQEEQRQLEEVSQRRQEVEARRQERRERLPFLARVRDQFPDVRVPQDLLDIQVEAFPVQIRDQINQAVVDALAEEFSDFPIDLDAVGQVDVRINNPERIAEALASEEALGRLIQEITEQATLRARVVASAIEIADREGGNISNAFLERLTRTQFQFGDSDISLGFGGEFAAELTNRVTAIREAAEAARAAEQESAEAFQASAAERTQLARIYLSTSDTVQRALLTEIQTIRDRAGAESQALTESFQALTEDVRARLDVESAYREAQAVLAEQAATRIREVEARALERREEALRQQLATEAQLRQQGLEALEAQLQPLDRLFDELEEAQRIQEAVSSGAIQSQEQLNRLREDQRRVQAIIVELQRAGADIDQERIQLIVEQIRLERERTEAVFRQQQELSRFIDSTVRGVGDVLANSIVDGLQTGRLAFRDFVNDIANTLIRSGIRELVAQIFSPQGNATQSIAASFISSFFGGFGGSPATPPIVPGAGGPGAFAQGGIVNMPTRFMTGGGMGLMGEAGPEAILPLRRTASGDLGVAATGGGSTVNVNTTVNVNGDSSDPRRTADLAAQSVERVVTSKVYEILARESRTGNLLSRPIPRF